MANPHCTQIIEQNKNKEEGAYTAEYTGRCKGEDKENGSSHQGMGNYFSIAKAKTQKEALDKMVRNRLRMGMWKQWKQPKMRIKNLTELGIKQQKAYGWGNSRKGYSRVAHSPILSRALTNEYFARLRYIGFANHYFWRNEHQTKLF
jgi:hypothetical protein